MESKMLILPASLSSISKALIENQKDLKDYINEVCDHIDICEPFLKALVPEEKRRERLLKESEKLLKRYPDPEGRPLLFGIPAGIKDIIHVEGFYTKAGSQLNPELLQGFEASCVKKLRDAGALILGKTVTTEFAYFEPGSTKNPHNLEHTPGGSSSGSAATVASGICPLALGTQTVGSIIRPAAYCGIVGFKPSYNRIPTDGLVQFSKSADHVGLFTQDVIGMTLASSLLLENWELILDYNQNYPILGVPDGPYLEQASPEILEIFEKRLSYLEKNGCRLCRIKTFEDIEEINALHNKLIAAEVAVVHKEWFYDNQELYRPKTKEIILKGMSVKQGELEKARRHQSILRNKLEELMSDFNLDLWVSPSTTTLAPQGINYTGDPSMNLPWTNAGLPAINLPAGISKDGLPVGIQFVSRFMDDEKLLVHAGDLNMLLARF